MTKTHVCINPIKASLELKEGSLYGERHFDGMLSQANAVMPYLLDFELTNKCLGSCKYCYSSSFNLGEERIPIEKIKEIFKDAYDLGVRFMIFSGGEPLLHPNWFEAMSYAGELGMDGLLCTTAMMNKTMAKRLVSLKNIITTIGVHIDSVVPEIYNKVHYDPSSLSKKIHGYRNLLEAGYPPEQISGLVTLSRPIMPSIEETVDWFVDEMGARGFCFLVFKEEGYGLEEGRESLEPPLSEVRKALLYRAKKLGDNWLKIGASDSGILMCRTVVHISHKGLVSPCSMCRDMDVGSIYEKRLPEIFSEHRDHLLFNFQVKGYCGERCEHRNLCWGCRATAYRYLGDIQASDPKCFMNPEAPEWVHKREG